MGNISELKQRNLLDIIKVIRQNGLITKPEITKLSALTSVTVHNFINELIEKKLVIENGNASSNGGRKAILYKINASFGYIIGQNLGINCVDTNIFDLDLNLLYRTSVDLNLNYSEKIVDVITQEIVLGIDQLGFQIEDCLGIGVTVPGQVDYQNGVIINLTNIPGWRSIPVKTLYQTKFAVPTTVENDNNANALASKWLKIVGEHSDAVFISFTSGVGTGVLTKGKLFHGSHSNAGEIGHTTIQYDGPKCGCGNRGCIEVFASDFTVVEKVKRIKKSKDNATCEDKDEIDIQAVVRMAKAGDEPVYNILKGTADFISIAIDHIIKLYGPEVIVIQSNWLKEFQDLFYYTIDKVFMRCAWINRDDLRITLSNIDNMEGIGAATLILDEIFRYSEDNRLLKKIAV